MDTYMKWKKARMEEGKMPIKSLWAGWRNETFQTQYTMWNCSWIPWKKNNLCNGHQYEMQKSGDGGGNNANKIFTSRVEEGYIPNTISYVELFTNTLKIRNNFCNWYYYKMHKSRDGGENNVYKVIMCWVEERNVLFKRKTCLKLFIASMKKKQFSELSRKVNSMKPKSQDRRGNNVNRTKKCKKPQL